MEPNHNEVHYNVVRPLGERISVLETHQKITEGKLDDISTKLDELLVLKEKGMGAMGLVSILFLSATGIAGVIASVVGFFTGRA